MGGFEHFNEGLRRVRAWIVAKRPKRMKERWEKTTTFAKKHYLTPIFVVAAVLALPWAVLVAKIVLSLFDQLAETVPPLADDRRAHFYAMGLTITGLGATLAAPFILVKAWVNERQARTAEQGHITDRITRAVEQLGAEKTVYRDGEPHTEPNLEVRLGAIYALERIAQDSERDHIPIMETLSAYVRQNISDGPAKEFPLGPYPERDRKADETAEALRREMIAARHQNWRDWLDSLDPVRRPRDDVAAVLKVFARRSAARRAHEAAAKPEFRIDLSHVNLQRVELSDADLSRVNLSWTKMAGADLSGAKMAAANLREAKMEGVNLNGAKMEGANLLGAKMEGANLGRVEMTGADVSWAMMEEANLLKAKMEGATLFGANMERTNLLEAKMEGANLIGTDMEGANLRGANLKSAFLASWSLARTNARAADLTDAKGMTQEQVNSLFGDRDTKLPAGLHRTDLMDRVPLANIFGPDREYAAWLKAGAPPGKPVAEE